MTNRSGGSRDGRGDVAQHASRPPWTVRVASWSARHRWPLIVAWFVFTIGLFVVSQALGGIRAVNATGGNEVTQTESGRAYEAMRSGGATTPTDELDVVVTSASRKVTDPAFHSTVESIVARLGAVVATVNGTTGPALTSLTDPYTTPPAAGYFAPDVTSVRIVGVMEGDSTALEARSQALAPVISSIEAASPGYEIHAISNTLINNQINTVVSSDLDGSLRISLPVTFVILLVAFGAFVAALVPLVLAISALLAAFGIFGIFSQLVEPVSPYATQLVVLVGLAVAIDYSLFMITRFRSERRAGRDRLAAIEVASSTAGRAVFFSGLAVMISLAGLFLLPLSIFQSMAIGTIAVIAVSVVGSLIFLPAVLSILGDGIDRGGVPFLSRRRGAEGGAWARIVRAVMGRPILAALAAAVVLLALASPITKLRLGEADITSFPESIDGVQAIEQLQTHWPQGTLLGFSVVVTQANEPATQAAIVRLEPAILAVPGLSGPAHVTTSTDGSVASVSVVMSGGENDPANWQIVRRVRTDIVPAVFGSLPGVQAYVGGSAAVSLDQTQIYTDGMVRIFAFVLGLSFVLLLLVFHSIVIPIKAILLNLLSTGAAFGALVLVFQEGWFGSQLGVRPTDVIQNWVPVFVFTILFGLSMDYEVFILARIKEALDQGADSHEAVARGITLTAGTVTSAAAIMVVVFAIFVTLRLVIIRELGLGLAVAIFVDATIIRSVMLPATMRLLGDWNWYLPGFLRWLPRITIEREIPREREVLGEREVPGEGEIPGDREVPGDRETVPVEID